MSLIAQRPAVGDPRPFRFPGFTRSKLDNGLTVLGCHLPGRLLGVAALVVDAGAETEAPHVGGVAALAARALTEGTSRRDAASVAEAVEGIGAELHAIADWDKLAASVTVPVRRLPEALGLLAEAVQEPSFPEAEIERLREERLNRIRQMMAAPRSRAFPAFWERIFSADGPYGRDAAGTTESVARISRDDVGRFHVARSGPERATLVLAGDLTDADPRALAADAFDAWSGTPADVHVAAPVPREASTAVTVIHRPGSVQSNLLVGQAGVARDARDHLPLDLAMDVLAGMFNSRLNMLLREQKGYTYGVGGYADPMRRGGFLAVSTAVQTPHTAESIADVVAAFSALAERGIDGAELNDARDYQLGVFPLRNETAQQIASLIGSLAVYGLPDDTYDAERDRLRALNADDVSAAIARVLRPDGLAAIVVGDADQIEEPLRAADIGDVTVITDD